MPPVWQSALMRKRSKKAEKPARSIATTSGIVGAGEQDLELTAEQLKDLAGSAISRLESLKVRKAGGNSSGDGSADAQPPTALAKRRRTSGR